MVIAFGVSWASWFTAVGLGGSATQTPTVLPYLFGAFGPLIGALVIRVRRGRRGEPAPEHVVRFRWTTLSWAPLLLTLASATVLSAALLAHAAGGPALSWNDAKEVMRDAGGPAAFLVGMVISGPLSEEPGWRGTAYPRMRASMGRFRVGLVLGVIWAVWHLPLFFIDGTVQNELGLKSPSGVLFAVSTIPMAMLTACAYERCRRHRVDRGAFRGQHDDGPTGRQDPRDPGHDHRSPGHPGSTPPDHHPPAEQAHRTHTRPDCPRAPGRLTTALAHHAAPLTPARSGRPQRARTNTRSGPFGLPSRAAAEDTRFELVRGCPQHAFQVCWCLAGLWAGSFTCVHARSVV
ncbi:CPBP family glutamic-type intramembrane protease [Streptomyces rugosispiralis]|uniref:CPBP family glutamic-type intramembrane protease n=1 Tax=Streptomyces rugosispiralis TaxID=2967341 RepID=A0ABT1VCP3_9ACTN|nr:CPBP family glutamic-type intramembrane protease [Streptomyces rugosispiralis]MCQ8195155.1 CPBP family glutamic-type intramembrane protease [Streptomyces rugosispiralis]